MTSEVKLRVTVCFVEVSVNATSSYTAFYPPNCTLCKTPNVSKLCKSSSRSAHQLYALRISFIRWRDRALV